MSYPKFMKRERTSLWVMAYGVYLCLLLSTVVEEGVKHPRAGPEEEPRSDTPVGPEEQSAWENGEIIGTLWSGSDVCS